MESPTSFSGRSTSFMSLCYDFLTQQTKLIHLRPEAPDFNPKPILIRHRIMRLQAANLKRDDDMVKVVSFTETQNDQGPAYGTQVSKS